MRGKVVYGAGVALLSVLVALVVWQGSFTFGDFVPASVGETYLFWAVSTVIFLLMVTLGFMLFRTGVRLYIERQSNREGTGIKAKLVIGALALSILPVIFLVLFSVSVLNRNLEKWFSRPAQSIRLNLVEVSTLIDQEVARRTEAQAAWLGTRPEILSYLGRGEPLPGILDALCRQKEIASAWLERTGGERLPVCNVPPDSAPGKEFESRLRVAADAQTQATLVVRTRLPADLSRTQEEIDRNIREYDRLTVNRKSARATYLLLLALITLFILFVATWSALFLARQISGPIAALLQAADSVRRGRLAHRIRTKAIDELGLLVRAFNEMTQELESNSRELERRRRFTEAILESIPTGVVSVSSEGEIQTVNRALSTIFSPEQVERAKKVEDLFPAEQGNEIRYLMNRARRTGVASIQLDYETRKQRLNLSVTASALDERVTAGLVIVIEDTSELLRAQKASAWHEVARRIAHEMKNPLTPISLSADRISRQLDKAVKSGHPVPREVVAILRECSQTIANEVQSVKTLVDEFSQFARFPSARPVPADLNEVVEEALSVFAGRLDGVELRKELAADLPPVNVDREQFKRVVVNLVDNAAEAMAGALIRRIFVSTHAAGADTVEMVVADTGCGVTPELREKLFLPYFSTKGRGTGLGLAIVSHILAEHGASIRVEDNLPVGARFIVEIPALTAQVAGKKGYQTA